MSRHIIMILLSVSCCLFGQGCTYRTWYEALQEKQRQDCYNDPRQNELQKCLGKTNSISYDEYKIVGRNLSSSPDEVGMDSVKEKLACTDNYR
jgi:hypothetical protein